MGALCSRSDIISINLEIDISPTLQLECRRDVNNAPTDTVIINRTYTKHKAAVMMTFCLVVAEYNARGQTARQFEAN